MRRYVCTVIVNLVAIIAGCDHSASVSPQSTLSKGVESDGDGIRTVLIGRDTKLDIRKAVARRRYNEKLSLSFFNDSDEPIQIIGFKTSCDCVALQLPRKIPAGSSRTIEIGVRVDPNVSGVGIERNVRLVYDRDVPAVELNIVLDFEEKS
jgi:hypothetical protein